MGNPCSFHIFPLDFISEVWYGLIMFVLLSPGGRRSQPFQSLQCPQSVPDFLCVDHVFPRKCMENDCWSNKQKNKSAGMSKNWSDGEWLVAAFCVPTKKVRRFGTQLLRFTVIYCSYGSRRSFRYRSKPSGGWHHWSHESLWHLGRSAREITAKGNFGMLVSGFYAFGVNPTMILMTGWWFGTWIWIICPFHIWIYIYIYGIILPID